MELCCEIHVVFMPANTTFIMQLVGPGVISTFKSYYLRNILHEAIDAIDNDSFDGSMQSKLKTFWKVFTLKNICDLWEEVKALIFTGVWQKLIPTLMGDFEGFRTSVDEGTGDVVKIAGELELEVVL
uniref:DDE-1 domain-containing protein n=1 Tax=Catagonus wagneri TaxID=51154 RepID=A0A8C3WTQ7_9CETA